VGIGWLVLSGDVWEYWLLVFTSSVQLSVTFPAGCSSLRCAPACGGADLPSCSLCSPSLHCALLRCSELCIFLLC